MAVWPGPPEWQGGDREADGQEVAHLDETLGTAEEFRAAVTDTDIGDIGDRPTPHQPHNRMRFWTSAVVSAPPLTCTYVFPWMWVDPL